MRFVSGLVVGAALVLVGEYLFLTRGGLPVAARDARALPLERYVAGKALEVAVGRDAARPAPIPTDAKNLLAGARVYRENCAGCHGAPDEGDRSAVAAGMFPRPPRLMPPGKGVTDDPVGETYWKVRHGIRMTGMPGFEGALSDTAIWQVSLLLLEAGQLPEPVLAALR